VGDEFGCSPCASILGISRGLGCGGGAVRRPLSSKGGVEVMEKLRRGDPAPSTPNLPQPPQQRERSGIGRHGGKASCTLGAALSVIPVIAVSPSRPAIRKAMPRAIHNLTQSQLTSASKAVSSRALFGLLGAGVGLGWPMRTTRIVCAGPVSSVLFAINTRDDLRHCTRQGSTAIQKKVVTVGFGGRPFGHVVLTMEIRTQRVIKPPP